MKFFRMQLALIGLGVGLGYLARFLLGAPAPESEDYRFASPDSVQRAAEDTVPANDTSANISGQSTTGQPAPVQSGLIEPFVPGKFLVPQPDTVHASHHSGHPAFDSWQEEFAHDDDAEFEPHGDQVCASGCALSRHPTEELTRVHFQELMRRYASSKRTRSAAALEELLYYGPQTRAMITRSGYCVLTDELRQETLWRELQSSHALVSIRVVDENNEIRTWIDATRVPLDRRHVFSMETKNLQPLVTSGTVKRVGLDHLWVRL